MTKNKLLELFEILKSKNIKLTSINYLKDISDADLNLILESKYPNIIARLISSTNIKVVNQTLRSKLISIINSTKKEIIADYTALLIENVNVLMSGLVYELAEIISKTEEEYQALNTLEVASNPKVLSKESSVPKLVKIISEIKGINKSNYATQVATNIDVLNTKETILLTKLISLASSDYQAQLASNIVQNITLLESPSSAIVYIADIIDAKDDEESQIIYNKVLKEIKKLEPQKKNNEVIGEMNFWTLYQRCPEGAITLLKDNVENNIEITPHTKIKYKR